MWERLLTTPPSITLWRSVNGIEGASGAFEKAIHQGWTGSDTIRVSQICYGKWLAEGGILDRIRHDQGFPNSLRKIPPQLAIFRNKFGKP